MREEDFTVKAKTLPVLSLFLPSARPTCDALSLGAEPRVDVSRLDLRVGRIVSVRRHPLAETLSVQEVDVGANAPRTVVSKLGEKTHLEGVTHDFILKILPLYFQNVVTFLIKFYNIIQTRNLLDIKSVFQYFPSRSPSAAPGRSSCVAMQRQGL